MIDLHEDFPQINLGRAILEQPLDMTSANEHLDRGLRVQMGLKRDKAKSYQPLRQLQDRQLKVVELLSMGMRDGDIARETGYTLPSISRIKNDPLTKRRISELQGSRTAEVVDISERIQQKAPEALDLLYKVMMGSHEDDSFQMMRPETRVKIAEKWLDRAGHAAVQKTASVNLSGKLDNNDISELKQRARESGLLVN